MKRFHFLRRERTHSKAMYALRFLLLTLVVQKRRAEKVKPERTNQRERQYLAYENIILLLQSLPGLLCLQSAGETWETLNAFSLSTHSPAAPSRGIAR